MRQRLVGIKSEEKKIPGHESHELTNCTNEEIRG
jgi:hypothetical protein